MKFKILDFLTANTESTPFIFLPFSWFMFINFDSINLNWAVGISMPVGPATKNGVLLVENTKAKKDKVEGADIDPLPAIQRRRGQ
jgi:hypothetical protein